MPAGKPALGTRLESEQRDQDGRTLRTISQSHAKTPSKPTSRKRPSHWLSRIGALRSGLSIPVCLVPTPCPRIGRRMPSRELRHEVGAPADESRITCERAFAGREAPPCGKEELFIVAIDPGAAILMTINMGIVSGKRRTDITWPKPEGDDVAATSAMIGVRRRSPVKPTRSGRGYPPAGDRDFARRQSERKAHGEQNTERDGMMRRPGCSNQAVADVSPLRLEVEKRKDDPQMIEAD